MKELERGKHLAGLIYAGKKSWLDLFERHTFFTKDYKYYLSVISASTTKEEQNMWSGWVQSRLRLLVKGIDESDSGVEVAHPYYKAVERFHRCKTEAEKDRVLSGSMDFVATEESKAADNGEEAKPANGEGTDGEVITIYTTTHYIGLQLREGVVSLSPGDSLIDHDVDTEGAKQLDISFPVSDFKRLVTSGPNYDEVKNAVRVVHTRKYVRSLLHAACTRLTIISYDLPTDLFDEGEVRPVRVKRTKTKAAKRSFADTGIDVRKTSPREDPAPDIIY
jgi:poly(A) polymerase